MAWDLLKARVSDIVKTNGNQAITGALLQSVLFDVIDTVGAESPNANTGWGMYQDTNHTSAAPFVLPLNTQALLPNNAGIKVESQLPLDVPNGFYNNATQRINGRNGDGLLVSIEFKARPTSNAADVRLKVTIDINGAIGEIYPIEQTLGKGLNEEHFILMTFGGYTLDTWEQYGGRVLVESVNSPIDIYDIRYVLTRTHKAR